MSLTPRQKLAVTAAGSVAVTAGAGTGKTEMLSERYLHHLAVDKFSPLEVVAVTFTDKAATELRARIREKVAAQLPDSFELIAEMEAAQISTIHALAVRVCREHPEAAGVAYDFNVMDELDSSVRQSGWLNKALDSMPAELYQQIPYSHLQSAIKTLLKDPIVAGKALARAPRDWSSLAAEVRAERWVEFVADPGWQQAFRTIKSLFGQAGDRMEETRRVALAASETIMQAFKLQQTDHLLISELSVENLHAALSQLDKLDLRGGSKKSWPQDSLDYVKVALKEVREAARNGLADGLIVLQAGETDERLTRLLPLLRGAFERVQQLIAEAKSQAHMLDFADIEAHALRALRVPEVREFYHQRWRAFLIDEFQDTNAVQAEILQLLGEHARLTIVGDEKQSIYGFRRADVEVFRSYRAAIVAAGGHDIQLAASFRAHKALIETVNQLFQPVLGDLHQDLFAERQLPPHPGPHLSLLLVDADEQIGKYQRQLLEAKKLAALVKDMLDNGMPVHDKITNSLRPIQPGDIAVLTRAWLPLRVYGDAFEACGIPITHAGGGSLLDTREAKDAWALLRFLADATDNLALAAVLRSPFFAVSDRVLFKFAESFADAREVCWWQLLQQCELTELIRPALLLGDLLKAARVESPSRLLQLADQLCGYSAVIGNLHGAARREADWRGFLALVRELEQRADDLFALVRRLRRLVAAEVEVPRLPLAAGNTVSLMTIHAAKGLEWPVVLVPDLTRSAPINSAPVYFDAEVGAALRLEREDGEVARTVLYTYLEHKQRQREEAEARRLLYVAITRARDQVILSATDERGGSLELLWPGLRAAGIEPAQIPFDPEQLQPPLPIEPELPVEPSAILIGRVKEF